MDDYWRETVELRGIDSWQSIAYPAGAPLTMRPDWRRSRADADPASAAQATLDRHQFAHAVCNSLFPVQLFRDENLGAAFARALNDWLAASGSARMRGSGARSCPIQSGARLGGSSVAPAMRASCRCCCWPGQHPLGKSQYWPIYAAASGMLRGWDPCRQQLSPRRCRLRMANLSVGGHAAQSVGFSSQLGSLICESVREVPQAQGHADQIWGYLAAAVSVACQVVARGTQRVPW
jgi:hypothetical protein